MQKSNNSNTGNAGTQNFTPVSTGDENKIGGLHMLSEAGAYPNRDASPFSEDGFIERATRYVSPWLADWEKSLTRAGWILIRKLSNDETECLPYEEMSPAFPEDADMYCEWQNIYLALLPSWMPFGLDFVIPLIHESYPGSQTIIHAGPAARLRPNKSYGDSAVGLLSAENTERCFDWKAVVEFNGALYSPDGANLDTWTRASDATLLDIYLDYRINSPHYCGK